MEKSFNLGVDTIHLPSPAVYLDIGQPVTAQNILLFCCLGLSLGGVIFSCTFHFLLTLCNLEIVMNKFKDVWGLCIMLGLLFLLKSTGIILCCHVCVCIPPWPNPQTYKAFANKLEQIWLTAELTEPWLSTIVDVLWFLSYFVAFICVPLWMCCVLVLVEARSYTGVVSHPLWVLGMEFSRLSGRAGCS